MIIQIVNQFSTVGGVQSVAKCLHKRFGAKVITGFPGERFDTLGQFSLVPKRALTVRGQFFPLDLTYFSNLLRIISRSDNTIIIHSPTLIGFFSLLIVWLCRGSDGVFLFVHARGDGIIGKFLFFLESLLIKKTRITQIYTSRIESVLSKRGGKKFVIPLYSSLPFRTGKRIASSKDKLHELKLGYVGRWSSYKGLPAFLEMLRHYSLKVDMPIVGLTLYGSGQPKTERKILRQVSLLKDILDVSIKKGFIPESELSDVLVELNVIVLPSTSRGEAFGIIQLDALNSGNFVLINKIASGTQSLINKCPRVKRYSDAEEFKDRLDEIIFQMKKGVSLESCLLAGCVCTSYYTETKFVEEIEKVIS